MAERMTAERMTAEREAEIEQRAIEYKVAGWWPDACRELLAEVTALREERDHAADDEQGKHEQLVAAREALAAEKARADRAEERMREAMVDRDSRHAADEARIDEHRRARDRAEAERDEARAQLAALRDKVLTWASRSIGDTHETIERNELLHAARRSRPDASSADAARERDAQRVERERALVRAAVRSLDLSWVTDDIDPTDAECDAIRGQVKP